jgi:hypothetical protein
MLTSARAVAEHALRGMNGIDGTPCDANWPRNDLHILKSNFGRTRAGRQRSPLALGVPSPLAA